MHKSVCTIDAPEFINLQPMDINPLMSACEIKVFYTDDNRNGSNIRKPIAEELAKTLRGAPIVGCFKEQKDDFGDHGEVVTIDGDGVHFSCETRPYGFVSPDAKVWFQNFEETDENGNVVVRTYLMTTGYLWTGQYPECKCAVEGDGKQHSMEFDKDSMCGYWEARADGAEFYIIDDAIFSKLCILGDDVEPCFEGSKVSKPDVSRSFALDDKFNKTLYTMMKDLQFALGGGQMENEINSMEQDKIEEIAPVEIEINTEVETEFVASKEEEKKNEEDKKDEEESTSEDENSSEEVPVEEKEDDKEKKAVPSKHELELEEANAALTAENTSLRANLEDLTSRFSALEAQNAELQSFKTDIENQQKDELLKSFCMLDDEDKAEYANNKEKYSYAEIKAALSVICFDKKINFTKDEKPEEQFTVDLPIDKEASLPDWVKAVKAIQENN